MKRNEINKMIETERVVLTKAQTFWHYSIVVFLLIIPALTTFDLFKDYVNGNKLPGITIGNLLITGYIWIIPAIIFFYIQKRRLQMHVINVSIDNPRFISAIENTAKELDWEIQQKTGNLVIAVSEFNWKSWGERITIIRCNDKILFNSICDPYNIPSVASFGTNKLNRKTFEHYLLVRP